MSRNQQLSNDDDLRLRFVRESAVLRDGLQDGKPFHSVKEFSHFSWERSGTLVAIMTELLFACPSLLFFSKGCKTLPIPRHVLQIMKTRPTYLPHLEEQSKVHARVVAFVLQP